ncbi:hypothetical protein [Mesorhizobium sp.]|uniref:hypothetical protein n=1 Tax=Mesorhizobium sp. TaxID=1871066 RepID=UPI000FE98A3B|nr:hypothetical protein [Mesorhizobium sp.]RWP72389.1 MAG: hypothetical protein EOR09_21330 [Mesorhizobium sp.]
MGAMGRKAFVSIDDRLDRLPADVAERLRTAFYKILDEVNAMIEARESDAAIAAHIDNWVACFTGDQRCNHLTKL